METRLKRCANWQQAIKEVVRKHARTPFAYGVFDGPLFAAEVLEAMTGHDVAKGLRGYRSAKGGMKKLRDAGFETPADPFAAVLKEIPVHHSQPGDIVVSHTKKLGICLGVRIEGGAYAVGLDEGLARASMADVIRAFRVPD